MLFVRVLRSRRIALLWGGQVLSALGDQLFLIAVLWLATRRLGSAAGLVIALGLAAALVCGVAGGVFADRWNRRVTLITADVARGLTVGVLAWLAWSERLHIWQLVLGIAVIEVLGTFFDPALQACLPALVPDAPTLYATNGLMASTHRVARILGPGLAGVLLLVLPFAHFFTLDAVSFGCSAAALALLGSRLDGALSAEAPARRATGATDRRRLADDLRLALRLAYRHRPFLWAVATLGVINLAWSAAFTVGVPLWTSRVLHGNAGAYGAIVGAYGIGNVVSLWLAGATRRWPLRAMYLGKIVQGAGFLLLASAPGLALALLGSGVAAVGGALGDLTLITMIQTAFPAEHIGKLYSLRATIGGAGLMLGLVVAGPLFAVCAVPVGIAACGVLIALVGARGLLRFWRAEWAGFSSPRLTYND